MLCAEPGAVITIGSEIAGDTISLTSGALVIDRDITLVDDPNDQIFIQGESVARVFKITSGSAVTFDGIQIICGEGSSGACIYNEGTLILRDSKFFNHDGEVSTASQILNEGEIRIENTVNLKRN